MTAAPIAQHRAPVRVRVAWAWAVVLTALRARAHRTRVRVQGLARPVTSTVLELAAAAAAVRAAFLLAPWLGWVAVAVALGVAGWMLEPHAAADEAAR